MPASPPCRAGSGRDRRAGIASRPQRAIAVQQLSSMTNRRDAQPDQIISGEFRQYFGIDIVCEECCRILLESQSAQPMGDVDRHSLNERLPTEHQRQRRSRTPAPISTAVVVKAGLEDTMSPPLCLHQYSSERLWYDTTQTQVGRSAAGDLDLEKARALLNKSVYDGRPVIFMQPSDLNANFNATVVVAEAMRKAGFEVDIQPLDWGTLSQRRNNKGPVDKRALTCSSPSPRRPMPRRRSPMPTSPPRAPTTSRVSPVTRSSSACAAAGGRAPTSRTRAARRPDPGPGVPGRAVHQRWAVEAVHGCADECQGWGRRRCRCFGRWRRRGDRLSDVESITLFKLLRGIEKPIIAAMHGTHLGARFGMLSCVRACRLLQAEAHKPASGCRRTGATAL